MRLFAAVGVLALLNAAALAAQPAAMGEERLVLARHLRKHDFEPRGSDPLSQDRDNDGWPDFWEAVRGDDYPPYLLHGIAIVQDPLGERPGLYRDQVGHVLRVPFDGTRVAIRTCAPFLVDPELAYEITLQARTERLNRSLVNLWVIWVRLEDSGREVEVDRDVLRIPPGQLDWLESPLCLRRNDLPADAKGLRLMIEIADDPEQAGADRFGVAWFDDIVIQPRPKLRLTCPFLDLKADEKNPPPLRLHIQYQGLIENAPGTGAAAKNYRRTLNLTDIFGEPPVTRAGIPIAYRAVAQISPGAGRTAEEYLDLPLGRLGVYYVTVTLFGHGGSIEAKVSQGIGYWQPAAAGEEGSAPPAFGFLFNAPAAQLWQRRQGMMAEIAQRAGVRQVKVHLWPADFKPQEETQPYLADFSRELHILRSRGVHVIGCVPAHGAAFRPLAMQGILKERPDALQIYLRAMLRHLGPQVEIWQWGDDADESFSQGLDNQVFRAGCDLLSELAAAMIQAVPITPRFDKPHLPPADMAQAVAMMALASWSPLEMAQALFRWAPDHLRRFSAPPAHFYPADWLRAIAPPADAADDLAQTTAVAKTPEQEMWLTIGLRPISRHERIVALERMQLDDMAIKAVIGRALGIPRIFLGRCLGEDGLLTDAVERLPRPSFLAVRTLEGILRGSVYLGSFSLREQFRNLVFRLYPAEANQAAIVLWYDGPADHEMLDRLELGDAPLTAVDLAGNRWPLGPREKRIMVRHTPILLLGMDARLALTRMSLDVAAEPRLEARHMLQRQAIAATNYYEQQLPITVRLRYAGNPLWRAGAEQLEEERNWTVRPEAVEINLPMASGGLFPQAAAAYEVEPDPTSVMGAADPVSEGREQVIWPTARTRKGEKYVRLTADFKTATPVRMHIYRKIRLHTDLEVRVIKQDRPVEDPEGVYLYLQMQVKWFPGEQDIGRGEITLIPYYAQKSRLPARRPRIVVPAYTEKNRYEPAVTVDLRIPRTAREVPTWIGLEEEGGTRFFRLEITPWTKFVRAR